jgi:hypothetical protein
LASPSLLADGTFGTVEVTATFVRVLDVLSPAYFG